MESTQASNVLINKEDCKMQNHLSCISLGAKALSFGMPYKIICIINHRKGMIRLGKTNPFRLNNAR